jgi:hypothetical protein
MNMSDWKKEPKRKSRGVRAVSRRLTLSVRPRDNQTA